MSSASRARSRTDRDKLQAADCLGWRGILYLCVMSTHPDYRPDIDGLRAVAILSVLIFHAFPTALGGGFVGVDIFFVISGFLISSIIFADMKAGSFSFKVFYMRRVRRLFPALLTVLATTLLAGWLLLFPAEFEELGKHIASGMGFIANFTLLGETGYFDKQAELKPLLHLWSLGIEEQFYIIWPLLLFGLWKWKRGLLPAALFLFAASFIYNVIEAYDDVEDAFFLPYSRFWEFSGGIALAYLVTYHPGQYSYTALAERYPVLSRIHAADLLSIAGALLIGLSVVFYSKDMAFPGWLAIAPVAGASMLIAAKDAWLNRTVLSARPMVWLGLISYPLYLWHWPVISFLHVSKMPVNEAVMAGALAVSVLLAWLTYRFIEKPVRTQPTQRFIPHLVVLGILMLFAGLAVSKGWVRSFLDIPEINTMLAANDDWQHPVKGGEREKIGEQAVYRYRSANKDEALFIGDSNMQQFMPRIVHLVETAPQQTYTATFITSGGCRPFPNMVKNNDDRCYHLIPIVKEYIDTHPVKRLVISGRWYKSFSMKNLAYRYPDGRLGYLEDPETRTQVIQGMIDMIKEVQAKGVEVMIVHNVPSGIEAMNGPTENRLDIVKLHLSGGRYTPVQDFAKSEATDDVSRGILAGIAGKTHARIIDPIPSMCGEATCPFFYAPDKAVYKDNSHITYSYARDHALFMDQTVLTGE